MQKFFRILVIAFCAISAGFLGGCAKYTPRELQKPIGLSKEVENVKVTAAVLTDADCHYYFSRRMASKGFVAVQLMIQNKGKETFVLDMNDVGLQLEDQRSIARALHLNTFNRVVAYLIPSLFLWPFIIPAAVEGVKSNNANRSLDRDFSRRIIDGDSRLIIRPGSTVNKVMVVRNENLQSSFDLVIQNKNTKIRYPLTLSI